MKYDLKQLSGDNEPILKKNKELFLYLNIPLSWIEECSRLGGSCLNTAIHILWVHYVTKKSFIKPQQARLKALGVERHAMYRSLKKLRDAGLIDYTSKSGSSPLISVLKIKLNKKTTVQL